MFCDLLLFQLPLFYSQPFFFNFFFSILNSDLKQHKTASKCFSYSTVDVYMLTLAMILSSSMLSFPIRTIKDNRYKMQKRNKLEQR